MGHRTGGRPEARQAHPAPRRTRGDVDPLFGVALEAREAELAVELPLQNLPEYLAEIVVDAGGSGAGMPARESEGLVAEAGSSERTCPSARSGVERLGTLPDGERFARHAPGQLEGGQPAILLRRGQGHRHADPIVPSLFCR